MSDLTSTTSATRSTTGGAVNRDTSRGTTTIDDAVVAKVAGLAVRDVRGVHDLGGGAARAIGALRSRLNSTDQGQGISVEVGERQAAVDVTVVAEYPVALDRLSREIRSSVIDAVQSLTGYEVTEVNITITDVHIPSDDQDDDSGREPRVI